MEEIKKLAEDQMISRTAALIWRYKVIYENFKILNQKPENNEYLIWDCLGKLRQIDIANAPGSLIMKHLVIAENEILARLVRPFESFLQSPQYKAWQDLLLEQEKQREKQSRVHRASKASSAPTSTANATPTSITNSSSATINSNLNNSNNSIVIATNNLDRPITMSSTSSPSQLMASTTNRTVANNDDNNSVCNSTTNSVSNSNRIIPCSNIYPDILIVDDSLVTLKLTGKTLENDGHHVDKANNGQVALQLMKSRPYDVVLIDINMPVMDGFETVRLFREFERSSTNATIIESDELSSISNSEGDFRDVQDSDKNMFDTFQQDVNMNSDRYNGSTVSNNLTDYDLKHRRRNLTAAHYHQLIIGISTNVDEETKMKAMKAG
jgi:CheY-like chemotaxis protein